MIKMIGNLTNGYEEGITRLIERFLETQNFQENYEVWVPYSYHGVTGFVDLVIDNKSKISLFKFLNDGRKIEKCVKTLKLESTIYPESKGKGTKDIGSYIIIEDSENNRKYVLSHYKLLSNQQLEILFFNRTNGSIETLSELKNIPRLFQTKKIRLNDDAFKKLISKPNHEEIETAIMNCENAPDKISAQIIEKMDEYLKNNETPPCKLSHITNLQKQQRTAHYKTSERNEIEDVEKVKLEK